ncbi:MAG TPA: hypothetical protein VKK79_09475 [Candidatus Lokiarchaeia archaeon]|nr:hypothetical protein [Candidatus Lokiarchaeia archaeon]
MEHLEKIHPSLWRRQVEHFQAIISELTQQQRSDLAVDYKNRLEDFKHRFSPWIPDAGTADEVLPPSSVVIILEKIGDELVLYPSNAPEQVTLFNTEEEARIYAAEHYPGNEISMPSKGDLSEDEVNDLLTDLFD